MQNYTCTSLSFVLEINIIEVLFVLAILDVLFESDGSSFTCGNNIENNVICALIEAQTPTIVYVKQLKLSGEARGSNKPSMSIHVHYFDVNGRFTMDKNDDKRDKFVYQFLSQIYTCQIVLLSFSSINTAQSIQLLSQIASCHIPINSGFGTKSSFHSLAVIVRSIFNFQFSFCFTKNCKNIGTKYGETTDTTYANYCANYIYCSCHIEILRFLQLSLLSTILDSNNKCQSASNAHVAVNLDISTITNLMSKFIVAPNGKNNYVYSVLHLSLNGDKRGVYHATSENAGLGKMSGKLCYRWIVYHSEYSYAMKMVYYLNGLTMLKKIWIFYFVLLKKMDIIRYVSLDIRDIFGQQIFQMTIYVVV